MPAPQVPVVHPHSIPPAVAVAEGSVQETTPAGRGGNGRADDLSIEITWAGVKLGLAASISAMTPDTSGAEKLVPNTPPPANVCPE
jgi:hypothetical protein